VNNKKLKLLASIGLLSLSSFAMAQSWQKLDAMPGKENTWQPLCAEDGNSNQWRKLTTCHKNLPEYSNITFSHFDRWTPGYNLYTPTGSFPVDVYEYGQGDAADSPPRYQFTYYVRYESASSMTADTASFYFYADSGSHWSVHYYFDTDKRFFSSAKIIDIVGSDATEVYINGVYVAGRNGKCDTCAPSNDSLPIEVGKHFVTGRNTIQLRNYNRGSWFTSSIKIKFQ